MALLIKALRKIPGIGEKTATRYAFYFLNAASEEVDSLVFAIKEIRNKLKLCSVCFGLTEADPCSICSDPRRDQSRICVVEGPMDILTIEKAGTFRGLYHVLHGSLSPLDAIGPEDIKIRELQERIQSGRIKEIILALNPTIEGETTAGYIRDKVPKEKIVVTRIAYGIPVGSTLEYADPLTLAKALDNRKEI